MLGTLTVINIMVSFLNGFDCASQIFLKDRTWLTVGLGFYSLPEQCV
jgi:hypothetical protein